MLSLHKSDEQLISLALNGSQRSWDKLVRRYEGLVYNFCLRMTGGTAEAMDLMQEVFLTVFRSLPSYRGQNQFKAWLMRLTTNKSIDYLRQRERSPQHYAENFNDEDFEHNYQQSLQSPHNDYAQSSKQAQVKNLMLKLSAEQRLVVELKFFQHLTFEEIAMQLNTSPNTIKTRLYASLNKLKDQVEKQHVL